MSDIEKYVEDAINGDSEAFSKLYEVSKRQVYFTCLRFLKNEQDAQDIMQEVYITVIKKLPELTDKKRFQAWVNRVAVNKCKNFLKSKRTVSLDEMQDDENYPEIPDDNLLPEEYVLNAAKRQIVLDIMEKALSDIQYQTVIMFYFDNMSVAEIAEITESPVGTVTYRLNAARAKIKKGVLNYEEKNKDKLHTIVPIIPFLTMLLNAEADSVKVPDLLPEISVVAETEIAEKGSQAANAANTVGNANAAAKGAGFLSTSAGKITAGVVALTVVCGGVGAGIALTSSNSDSQSIASSEYNEAPIIPFATAIFEGSLGNMSVVIGDEAYTISDDMDSAELQQYLIDISENENIGKDGQFYFIGKPSEGTSFAVYGNVFEDVYYLEIIPDYRIINGKPACNYKIMYNGDKIADNDSVTEIVKNESESIKNEYMEFYPAQKDDLNYPETAEIIININSDPCLNNFMDGTSYAPAFGVIAAEPNFDTHTTYEFVGSGVPLNPE